jgi:SSS family solute:Na+ symporter
MVNANGASGIWAMLAGGLINLPVFWMTSIWYRRLRVLTMGDFFV